MLGRSFVIAFCALLAATSVACGGDDPPNAASTPSVTATAAAGSSVTASPLASASVTPTPVPLVRTEVIRYQPPVAAASSVTGSCFTLSLAVERPDAWRCSTGNQILDPCFGAYDSQRLVCVTTPFDDSKAVELNLLRPACTDLTGGTSMCRPDALPPANPAAPKAWAFETASGVRCVMDAGGTAPVLNGERLNFPCRDSGAGVIGMPVAGTIWTARRVETASIGSPDTWKTPVAETEVQLKTVWW